MNRSPLLLSAGLLLIASAGESQERTFAPEQSDLRIASATPNAPLDTALPRKAQNAPKVDGRWNFFGSWRLRAEYWQWFPTPAGDGNYSFLGSILRFGVNRQTTRDETMIELAAPALINLPTTAIVSPRDNLGNPRSQGQLGLGGTYYGANGSQVASLFVKQGYIRFKNAGSPSQSLKLGRFEFSDGMELPAKDPSLAYLKRERIGQRLLGPFTFPHVGRSFDGLQFSSDTPGRNTTALLAFPTRGVFALRGMDTLDDVRLAYVSVNSGKTTEKSASDGRLFGIYYGDTRPGVVKTDNRPLATRQADTQGVHLVTLGGHYARVFQGLGGKVDTIAWAAGQFGTWGPQRHAAFAGDIELGYQPKGVGWNPWFRLGYYYASGDGGTTNNQHGTFFPILPTPRLYARFPFYTETNIQDAFLQAILKPTNRWTIRTDLHRLWLADEHDLWYSGGGAFENATFGYTGRPSGGSGDLGTLLDLSAEYQVRKNLSLTAYLGYAHGGNIVQKIYSGRDALYGYLEMMLRF